MEGIVNKQAAAILTAAMVGKTSEIESYKTIVDIWREYDRQIKIESDVDYLAAILTTARVWDIKPDVVNIPEVANIYRLMRAELENQMEDAVADDQNVLCAQLAAAYVAITPEIETVSEIKAAFDSFMEDVTIADDYDKLAAYLVTGRMHDTRNKLEPHEVPAIMKSLKELLRVSVAAGK